MHNKVNERLGKPEFECSNIDDKYPCGCAAEEQAAAEEAVVDTTI
jgi:FAD-linked sulfhydryl oxidase